MLYFNRLDFDVCGDYVSLFYCFLFSICIFICFELLIYFYFNLFIFLLIFFRNTCTLSLPRVLYHYGA